MQTRSKKSLPIADESTQDGNHGVPCEEGGEEKSGRLAERELVLVYESRNSSSGQTEEDQVRIADPVQVASIQTTPEYRAGTIKLWLTDMEDFLEDNCVTDSKQIARLVRSAFQRAEYGIRDRIHTLTQEKEYDWKSLRARIASMLMPDLIETQIRELDKLQAQDLAPSEKYQRIKTWYSSDLDRISFWMLTIGGSLAIRTHHYAADIGRSINSSRVI
ncbi:hypothetical protein Ciccas_012430, partial [Cichlidogyrus casuarinus]